MTRVVSVPAQTEAGGLDVLETAALDMPTFGLEVLNGQCRLYVGNGWVRCGKALTAIRIATSAYWRRTVCVSLVLRCGL